MFEISKELSTYQVKCLVQSTFASEHILNKLTPFVALLSVVFFTQLVWSPLTL